MNGLFIIGIVFNIPLVITVLIALYFRHTFLVIGTIFVMMNITHPSDSISGNMAIAANLFIGVLLQRIKTRCKRYPLVSDNYGLIHFFYSKLPFSMANWRWYSRTKNLLNTLTFWLDTISIPLVAVLLCAGFISGNEKYSVVIVIYVMVWIVYLLYIVAPLMSIECIGRILYTLTVKDNFPVLVSWIVGGFRKSEILVTQSKPYTNSKNWLTEGFKQPPEEQ